MHLCVNSGMKDFFVVVQVYAEPHGIIKNYRFQCLPISYDRDELTEGLVQLRTSPLPVSERAKGRRSVQNES